MWSPSCDEQVSACDTQGPNSYLHLDIEASRSMASAPIPLFHFLPKDTNRIKENHPSYSFMTLYFLIMFIINMSFELEEVCQWLNAWKHLDWGIITEKKKKGDHWLFRLSDYIIYYSNSVLRVIKVTVSSHAGQEVSQIRYRKIKLYNHYAIKDSSLLIFINEYLCLNVIDDLFIDFCTLSRVRRWICLEVIHDQYINTKANRLWKLGIQG